MGIVLLFLFEVGVKGVNNLYLRYNLFNWFIYRDITGV